MGTVLIGPRAQGVVLLALAVVVIYCCESPPRAMRWILEELSAVLLRGWRVSLSCENLPAGGFRQLIYVDCFGMLPGRPGRRFCDLSKKLLPDGSQLGWPV